MEKMIHLYSGYRYNNEIGKLEWMQIHPMDYISGNVLVTQKEYIQ